MTSPIGFASFAFAQAATTAINHRIDRWNELLHLVNRALPINHHTAESEPLAQRFGPRLFRFAPVLDPNLEY